jgi:transposase
VIPCGVQVFVALEPVDMRYGFERLSGLVGQIGYEARSGALFVFFGKRRETAKILFFDGTGLCVFYKRLDRGTFVVPSPMTKDQTHLEIDDAALETLLDGIEIVPTGSSRLPRDKIH